MIKVPAIRIVKVKRNPSGQANAAPASTGFKLNTSLVGESPAKAEGAKSEGKDEENGKKPATSLFGQPSTGTLFGN